MHLPALTTASVVKTLKEGVFDSAIIEDIGVSIDGPLPCLTDNKAAYDVIRNPGATKRTIHFARWMHYARELQQRNQIKIHLIGTEEMVADIFTKPLDPTTFRRFRDYLMTEREAAM